MSTSKERICVIVNPRAAGGRAARRRPELERLAASLFESFEVRFTEGPGHAREMARQAASEDFQVVAAAGGDGTCHEVVNGLMDFQGSRPIFTVIPLGTGSDLIKSLRIPKDAAEAVRLAAQGQVRSMDLGKATFLDHQDQPQERFFANVAGFGANGDVVARANRSSKRFGGTVTFVTASLETTLMWKPVELRISWQGPAGEGSWEGLLLSAFVANGHYCGGGMWVGKDGAMDDGLLELTLAPPMSFVTSTFHLFRLYQGTIERTASVRRAQVTCLKAEPLHKDAPPVLIDLDGEGPGKLPFEVRTIRGALRVRGGW